jgi:hypothetical protein
LLIVEEITVMKKQMIILIVNACIWAFTLIITGLYAAGNRSLPAGSADPEWRCAGINNGGGEWHYPAEKKVRFKLAPDLSDIHLSYPIWSMVHYLDGVRVFTLSNLNFGKNHGNYQFNREVLPALFLLS